ncbi:MAG: 2-oxoacid:acceptor oxidoreductase [Clostridiales bacterium 43-6]|nr:MAG: 2-oxoacid:acceptor oxidoreductase [Clostridiales bacterium 43-6]
MNQVTIFEDRCKGCELCIQVCPKKILKLTDEKLNAKGYHFCEMTDEDACIACAMCAQMCPDVAIKVEK